MNFDVKQFINEHCITKDFPVKGVKFVDIFPLVRKFGLNDVVEFYNFPEPIVFVPEARGFIFMDVIGAHKCIPIRKEGKLPGELLSYSSTKEYGTDQMFFQKSALEELINEDHGKVHEVVFFDDLLATGGTAQSFVDFIEKLNLHGHTFKVTRCCFYVELTALKGRNKITVPVESVYRYE